MSKKIDGLGISAFFESMGLMLRSGIQVDEALGLLTEGEGGSGKAGPLESALRLMQQSTQEGSPLASAMEESGAFPDYAVSMVSAGESSGRLEDTLFRLSEYYARESSMSERLKSAVTYPAAMLCLIIAVLAVMLVMVLPAFTDIYNDMTGSLSASGYGYVRLAYVFCWAALAVMVLLAAGLIAGYVMWKRGARGPVERVLRLFPICSELLDSMGRLRFTSAMSTFLSSGMMQDDALERSIPMTGCEPVERKLRRCAERMADGHSIARAAYDEELFEPVYGRMLLAGERSGSLEQVLGRLTGHLEENCENLTDRLVGTVDPALSGVLMVTVGLSLLSVMLPLIGIMNSIG